MRFETCSCSILIDPWFIKNWSNFLDWILLQYQTYLAVNSDLNLKPKQVPVVTFLRHTTDYLFSMMDKLLLENRRSPQRSSPTRSFTDLGIGPTYNNTSSMPRRPLRMLLFITIFWINSSHALFSNGSVDWSSCSLRWGELPRDLSCVRRSGLLGILLADLPCS
jgi:hypothetical protein